MTQVVQAGPRPVERSEVGLWFVAVGILSLVSGLGTVAAIALVLTRLRPCSRRLRIGLVVSSVLVGAAVLALAFLGLQTGRMTGELGPVVVVDPGTPVN